MQMTTIRSLSCFIFIALFYAITKIMRAALAPLVNIFIHNNILTDSQVAMLASAFSLVAGIMCLPAGVVVAKIGIRKSYIIAALLVLFGTLIFSISTSFSFFLTGRIITAIGYSFVFPCAMLAIYNLLREKHYAFFTGALLFIGYMGESLAGLPISEIIESYNWHIVFIGLTIIQLIFFVITIAILPRKRRIITKTQLKIDLKGILAVFKNKDTLISTAIVGCLIAANFSIADVWGKTYLIEVYNYQRDVAALAGSSIIFIAAAFGGIVLGYLESIKLISWDYIKWFSLLSIIAIVTFVYVPLYSYTVIITTGILIGVSKSSTVLLYSYIKKYSAAEYIAIAIALTTVFEMIFSSIINFLIGIILKVCKLFNFSLANSFQIAMIVIVIALIFNLLMALQLKKATVNKPNILK